jgi:hypothetical protein
VGEGASRGSTGPPRGFAWLAQPADARSRAPAGAPLPPGRTCTARSRPVCACASHASCSAGGPPSRLMTASCVSCVDSAPTAATTSACTAAVWRNSARRPGRQGASAAGPRATAAAAAASSPPSPSASCPSPPPPLSLNCSTRRGVAPAVASPPAAAPLLPASPAGVGDAAPARPGLPIDARSQAEMRPASAARWKAGDSTGWLGPGDAPPAGTRAMGGSRGVVGGGGADPCRDGGRGGSGAPAAAAAAAASACSLPGPGLVTACRELVSAAGVRALVLLPSSVPAPASAPAASAAARRSSAAARRADASARRRAGAPWSSSVSSAFLSDRLVSPGGSCASATGTLPAPRCFSTSTSSRGSAASALAPPPAATRVKWTSSESARSPGSPASSAASASPASSTLPDSDSEASRGA